MESYGEECYRIFGTLIDHYVNMFELAETEWICGCWTNMHFTDDFHFVSSLPTHELRIFFWLDKIKSFNSVQFANALSDLQSQYIQYKYWRLPPYIHSREEAELFYLLRILFTDETSGHAPFFSKCVCSYYKAIGF